MEREIAADLKKWSINAALQGAPGAAEEFIKAWGVEIANVHNPKTREAFRKQLNDLIPGTADDFSTATFAKWIHDIQAKAQEDAKDPAKQSFATFLGTLFNQPKEAIDNLAADGGAALKTVIATITSDPVLAQNLFDAGVALMEALGKGISSDEGEGAISKAVHGSLGGLTHALPSSPVKEGPLKHPFLLEAGKRITRQIAEGIGAVPLTLPTPKLAPEHAGAFGPTSGMGRHRGGKGEQHLHVDRLQVLGPADERSILARVAFLQNN